MKIKKDYVTLIVAKNLDMQNLCLTKGEKIKALFIVSQINYRGEFDLYFNLFKKLMGLNSLELNRILDELINNNIIKKITDAKYKENCATYTMVTPFNIEKDEVDKVSFSYEAPGTPMFINRFIANGFSYINKVGYNPRNNTKVSTSESANLQQRIKQLEDLLISNNISIPAFPELQQGVKAEAKHEAPVIKLTSEAKPDIATIVGAIANAPTTTVLNDSLSIVKDTNGLSIRYKEESAYIENYFEMAYLCEPLDTPAKINLFTSIITERCYYIHVKVGNEKLRLTRKSTAEGIILTLQAKVAA